MKMLIEIWTAGMKNDDSRVNGTSIFLFLNYQRTEIFRIRNIATKDAIYTMVRAIVFTLL
jgi:hypothetical protein